MSKENDAIFAKVQASIDKSFDRFNKPENLKKFALKNILLPLIKRTRLGFGVREDSKQRYRFPKLSDSYKLQRAGLIKFATIKGIVIPFYPKGKAATISKPIKARKKKGIFSKPKNPLGGAKPKAKGKKSKKKIDIRAKNLSSQTSASKSNLTATGLLLNSALGIRVFYSRIEIFVSNLRYTKNIFGDNVKNGATTDEVVDHLRNMDREFLQTSKTEDNAIQREISNRIIKEIEASLK